MIKIALFAVLCFAAAALAAPPQAEYDVSLSGFHSWMSHHGKEYATNEEKALRYRVWSEAMTRILDHNAAAEQGVHTYTMGMNEFGDLTWTEFQHMYLGTRVTPEKLAEHQAHERQHLASGNVQLPSSVDWRTKNAVTHAKNQGQCGSCWSFSTTGSVEGAHVLQYKKPLVSCSEQQLIDCSVSYGNQGCNGGLMTDAFKYIMASPGLDSEDAYPYLTRQESTCKATADGPAVATIANYRSVQSGSESALESASGTVGPISVAIDASHSSFQFYNGGVYYEPACSSTQLDHGVLVVGYGVDNGSDYWLVKNSWGASWGLQGYIMMSRNRDNNCGIATMASYPEA